MHKLVFKEGKRIAAFLDKCKDISRIPYTNETTDKRGVWLCKDDGIYVMPSTGERFSNDVVYASGYHAESEGCWDATYNVSPDDFAEFVSLTDNQIDNLRRGSDLTINISEETMEVIA